MTPFSASQRKSPDHALRPSGKLHQLDGRDRANRNSRDNARTPLQWDSSLNAGFTSGTPWIEVNPNASEINVEQDVDHEKSVFAHYRELVKLRRELDIVSFGETEPLLEDSASVMAYQRRLGAERLVVLGNFTPKTQYLVLPEGVEGAGRALVWSHGQRDRLDRSFKLAPFESVALLIET